MGVAYSLAAGDQPALIKELCDFARTLGLEVVSAGKGSVVRSVEELRRRAEAEGRQVTTTGIAFNDGSKNQEEMAATANMTGLVPDVRGMHKPAITLSEVVQTLIPREHGGILSRSGVVDFVTAYTLDWANETGLLGSYAGLRAYMERMYARPMAPLRIAAAFTSLRS